MFRCEVCPYFFRLDSDYGYEDVKIFDDVNSPDGWCVQKNKGIDIIGAPCNEPDFNDPNFAPLHDTTESQDLINSLIRGNLEYLWEKPPALLNSECKTNAEKLQEIEKKVSPFKGVDLGVLLREIVSSREEEKQ